MAIWKLMIWGEFRRIGVIWNEEEEGGGGHCAERLQHAVCKTRPQYQQSAMRWLVHTSATLNMKVKCVSLCMTHSLSIAMPKHLPYVLSVQYYTLRKVSLGAFDYEKQNDSVPSPKICLTTYKNYRIFAFNDSYQLDLTTVTGERSVHLWSPLSDDSWLMQSCN